LLITGSHAGGSCSNQDSYVQDQDFKVQCQDRDQDFKTRLVRDQDQDQEFKVPCQDQDQDFKNPCGTRPCKTKTLRLSIIMKHELNNTRNIIVAMLALFGAVNNLLNTDYNDRLKLQSEENK
jgi:hypothetical protein